MRDIKFRGKTDFDGVWVYGSYFYDAVHNQHFILTMDMVGNIRETRVNPVTVGQFIGRVDHNGREIYEGDNLKYWYKNYPVDVERSNLGEIKTVAWNPTLNGWNVRKSENYEVVA